MRRTRKWLWQPILAALGGALLLAGCGGGDTAAGHEDLREALQKGPTRPNRRLWTDVEPLPPPEVLAPPTPVAGTPGEGLEGGTGEQTGETAPTEDTGGPAETETAPAEE